MPPTQYILSGEVAPPPNFRDALMSFLQGADPLDPRAPQGPHPHPKKTPQGPPQGQGKGRGAKGPRALGAIGGGWANGALWGYSEAIPNGKLFRSKSEWKGHSEWMALPNGKLCHVFTQPRKR